MVYDLNAAGREWLESEGLVQLLLGVVEFGEGGAHARAALAAAGGWVDEGDFVDLVEQAHREFGAERQPLVVDAGVADVAFDQRDEHQREGAVEAVDLELLVGPVEGG